MVVSTVLQYSSSLLATTTSTTTTTDYSEVVVLRTVLQTVFFAQHQLKSVTAMRAVREKQKKTSAAARSVLVCLVC